VVSIFTTFYYSKLFADDDVLILQTFNFKLGKTAGAKKCNTHGFGGCGVWGQQGVKQAK